MVGPSSYFTAANTEPLYLKTWGGDSCSSHTTWHSLARPYATWVLGQARSIGSELVTRLISEGRRLFPHLGSPSGTHLSVGLSLTMRSRLSLHSMPLHHPLKAFTNTARAQ